MDFVRNLLHPLQYSKVSNNDTLNHDKNSLQLVTSPRQKSAVAHAVISVKGMTCAACSGAVEAAIQRLDGVQKVSVALLQEVAKVSFDPNTTRADDLVTAVEDAGFDGSLISLNLPTTTTGMVGQSVCLSVMGMTCAACSGAVECALLSVSGVQSANVSLTQGLAEVQVLGPTPAVDLLIAAVEDAGFDVKLINTSRPSSCDEVVSIKVAGMTSGACSSSIEGSLKKLPGVTKAVVNHVTALAEVTFESIVTGPRHFVTVIEDCGFEAEVCPPEGNGVETSAAVGQELVQWSNALRLSLLFTIPVFFLSMVLPMLPGGMAIMQTSLFGFPCITLLKLVLVTPVQFYVGARFYRGAFKSLRRGSANMDVLVAMGTTAAYVYSVVSVMYHNLSDHHENGAYVPTEFFETSAMIISLILMGKYLECSAKGKTSEAITKLLRLTPEIALLVERDDSGAITSEQQIPCHLIHKNDVLKVLPGGRIPTDGLVLSGSTFVNESMITGEPKTVWKHEGDAMIGGTVSNGNGSGTLLMQATKVGSETVLSQIVRLVQQAQMTKAPVQAFADKVAGMFVPIVIALAFLTWMTWYICGVAGAYPITWLPLGHTPFLFALLFAISVVVIACPCALGLATPTAVMVGTGVAATQGILIKGGDGLERASKVDLVIFDKTGTLTLGRPSVISCHLLDEMLGMPLLVKLLAAAESASEHPLARAVLEYCSAHVRFSRDARLSDQNPTSNKAQALNPVSQSTNSSSGLERKMSVSSANGGSKATSGGLSGRAHSGSLEGHSRAALLAEIPAAHDTVVAQGMGISCWVSCLDAEMTPQQQLRFQEPSGSAGPDPSPLPASSQQVMVQGGGDRATLGRVRVAVGNRLHMREQGIKLPDGLDDFITPEESKGHTCVLVAVGGRLVALLSIADPLKPEALSVIAALKAAKVSCCMLTGDNKRTAHAVAAMLHVDAVFAEVLPAEKAQVVRDLQAQRHVVAMVGDGINDSPALAAADVGIAIGSGTDIAIESADYVLMRDCLGGVMTALEVSRYTLRTIRFNYFFAMVYNVVMIPVAAGALYPVFHCQLPPWIAGACMAFSSVSVVCSSLMIKRFKPSFVSQKGVASVKDSERTVKPVETSMSIVVDVAVGSEAERDLEDAFGDLGQQLLHNSMDRRYSQRGRRGSGQGAASNLPPSLARFLGRSKRLLGSEE
ncbi:hypothetical protein CEUSTIGMA_g6306.t1 [Chlamydomonas eustigma]|uniref:P-type Cu(+) transporter n=1 Tax=Chlamydomonas eustigma TaxID=1157962 RepID=A0A250X716_9CHLO|nr:hypothetical protein CEUSTIGMA_g6306.t1 [Chlamydomonas eustigma]|eukprot:GAX78867.1 hypothetical protein CEUSTIGMA_g6306.t1 [Chlamydomonas eustigma]